MKDQTLLSYMKENQAEVKGFVININDYAMEGIINDGLCNIVYDILVRKEGINEKEAAITAIQDYRSSFGIVVHETIDKSFSIHVSAKMGLSITNEELDNKVIDYLKEYHKVNDIESNTLLRFVIDYTNKENECLFYFAGDVRGITGMPNTLMLNIMDYPKA